MQQNSPHDTWTQIEPVSLLRSFTILWQSKLTILAVTLVAIVCAGYVALYISQPRFTATAMIKIEPAQNPLVDQIGTNADINTINTEIAVLTSRQLLETLVHDMALMDDPMFNRYLNPTSLWSNRGMRTYIRNTLTGTVEQPPTREDILRKTTQNLRDMISTTPLRNSYILNVTATTGHADKSTAIANRLVELYIVDQIATQNKNIENTIFLLANRVSGLQQELQIKETTLNNKMTTAQAYNNSALPALFQQVEETEDRLQIAHGILETAQTELAQIQRGETVPNLGSTATPAAMLRTDIARQETQIVTLTKMQTDLAARLNNQSTGLVAFQQLQRETDATRIIYQTFLARLQEAQAQQGLHNGSSRILSPATMGIYAGPRKMLILLIAGMIGLTVGGILILARDALQTGFTTANELAKTTQVKVLSTFSKMSSNISESAAMCNLRTALLLHHRPKVILFTSTTKGEGKTTQAAALTQNLASLGKNTLLIEADKRHFGTAENALLNAANGANFDDCITHYNTLHADVLGGYEGDFFATPAFTQFLIEMRDCYDHIVIDGPAMSTPANVRQLAQLADAIIYTVRWGKTNRQRVLNGLQILKEDKAPVTGVTLSQAEPMSDPIVAYVGSKIATYRLRQS